MSSKPEPRKPLLEAVPKDTFENLLPYEMERAERVMEILFYRKTDSAVVKKETSRIATSLAEARVNTENGWGHEWRPSPDIDRVAIDHALKLRKAERFLTPNVKDDIYKDIYDNMLKDDPIAKAAIAEHRASRARKEVPE